MLLVLALVVTGCDVLGEGGGSAGRARSDVVSTDFEPEFDQDPDCFGFEPADAEQVECGTVEGPLDHDSPADGTIELAVVVDGADAADGVEAPLLVLGGGPGEVLVEPYLTTPQLRQVFAAGRTTIVIDQRGVGSSDPALVCPEVPALDAMGECRQRLIGDGVDLDAYNHVANTRLRSAVEETVERLDVQPEQVTVQAPDGEATTVTYTPSRFLGGLFIFFYQPQLAAMLPAVLDRAHDGDLAPLANIVTLLEEQLEGGITAGMQQSMLCTGEAGIVDPEQALADVDDELIAEHWYPRTMLGEPIEDFCELWDVEQVYDPSEITLDAQVPTLVVTGGLDHVMG